MLITDLPFYNQHLKWFFNIISCLKPEDILWINCVVFLLNEQTIKYKVSNKLSTFYKPCYSTNYSYYPPNILSKLL